VAEAMMVFWVIMPSIAHEGTSTVGKARCDLSQIALVSDDVISAIYNFDDLHEVQLLKS
jgi:hypothetical protein